jgi:glycosyltransferase involved in cell wall biosynthesis
MKVLYIVNVDWFFISHRLPLAIEAKKRGYEVFVLAGDTGVGASLKSFDITFIPWNISRSGTNFFKEIQAIAQLFKVFRHIKPHLVHNVGVKAVIYGSLASQLFRKSYINALAGMGFAFTADTLKAQILRVIIKRFFVFIFKSKKSLLILQNEDDKKWFLENGYIDSSKLRLIKGSGVNLNDFKLVSEPTSIPPIVCLPSRMLWDKGIGEFIEAIRILKTYGLKNIRFVLAGGIDTENPAKIPQKQLQEWVSEGIVEWWGYQTDMPNLLSKVTIVVLPSYKEGLPKVLLEAAAIGRAIITTDVVGCREIIKHDYNGILVPPQNAEVLAEAISKLLNDSELRKRYIENGFELVKQNFTIETVTEQTFNLYDELLTEK